VFDERALLRALAIAAPQGAEVSEVRAQTARFVGRADVIWVGEREMTSADLVARERVLLEAAIGRADERCGVLDPAVVDRMIAGAPWPLSEEQAAGVRSVCSSGAGVSVVEALAGTGKTYTASVLRELYESAGLKVIGAAPTGRGARELSEQAGVRARTLDRLLSDLEHLGGSFPHGCVVILDEAGMAPTRASARLLAAARDAGAKVIALGDPGQLGSVQAGGWLGSVGRHLGVTQLRKVMRQRDAGERRALAALHAGRPQIYLKWAEAAGRIDTFADSSHACREAVAQWGEAAGRFGVDQAVMIARENSARERLNTAARELMRARGLLGPQQTYGSLVLAVGDRLICRRNDRRLDVDNGTRGTVRHLRREHLVIDTDAGLVRTLPASYVQEHVEHAYALTCHCMQGATVESAFVVASSRDLTAGWSYTALSRARGQTHLYVHGERRSQDRAEFAPVRQRSSSGRDELLARASRRMLERDDEHPALEQLQGVAATAGGLGRGAPQCGAEIDR
jgi:ATP-dependent exoDNAse (exonuclease V) alpha subunit